MFPIGDLELMHRYSFIKEKKREREREKKSIPSSGTMFIDRFRSIFDRFQESKFVRLISRISGIADLILLLEI